MFCRNIVRRLVVSYKEFHAHAAVKIKVAAYIGIVTLPAYHFIWQYFSVAIYQNLPLRLVGVALCIGVITTQRWPATLAKYQLLLSYGTTVFCLPFFFSFMTLMNGASHVWQLSSVAAVVYLVFLFDSMNILVATLLGIGTAIIAFWVGGAEVSFPPSLPAFLLVLVFAVVSMILLNYGEHLIVKSKVAAAAAMAGQVAHEIRTPLLSIRLEIEKLQEIWSSNSDRHKEATNRWLQGKAPDQSVILSSFDRIANHVSAANIVIEMLLTSVGHHHRAATASQPLSMRATVSEAVDRYPFKGGQRDQIQLQLNDEFQYTGSHVLMIHLIFNLLKNALRAIAKRGSGTINIILKTRPTHNELIITDTGNGIPDHVLPYIFVPFYTTERADTGSGIGLSFCREVVESMAGNITCEALVPQGTKFTIRLPLFENHSLSHAAELV